MTKEQKTQIRPFAVAYLNALRDRRSASFLRKTFYEICDELLGPDREILRDEQKTVDKVILELQTFLDRV